MYGIPVDFPYESLKNAELQQICFGQNEVIFNLTNEISVIVMSEIQFGPDKNNRSEDFKLFAPDFLSLLGKDILSVSSENNKDMAIRFSDGTILTVIDNSDSYESYVIFIGSRKYAI